MKIGILTLPLRTNIGGILQCYALQTVLQNMGHEVVVLDRDFSYPSFKVLLRRLGSFVKCLVKVLILKKNDVRIVNPFKLHYYPSYTVCDNSRLDCFVNMYICKTKPIRSSRELRLYVLSHHLDCIVVGSDQVWRESYSPSITDYFLGFIPSCMKIKRIAYAASFGASTNSISSLKMKECVCLAKEFNFISMREASGVEMLKSLFGLDAVHVLDPTLLLKNEHYMRLINVKNIHVELETYILDRDSVKDEIIDYISDKMHLSRSDFSPELINGVSVHPTVESWLSVFENADFIVTDSFHGCVFSIIFRKRFMVILNGERGVDRIYSLLDMFGLNDRLIRSFEDIKRRESVLYTPIDYDAVYERYGKLKDYSMSFLCNALK